MTRALLIIFALFFSFAVQAADQTDGTRSAVPADAGESMLTTLPAAVRNLLGYAESQAGVAYRRGGADPEKGFDCSGFVRYVFDHVEGLDLPHSSRAMSLIGSRIKLAELKPGDLVFFRIMRHNISHVGIYLGNNRFIHAASTRTGSVMISDLTEGYWARRFTLARRIEPPAESTLDLKE
jgi:cell wall-associated NlpC family hydrolase